MNVTPGSYVVGVSLATSQQTGGIFIAGTAYRTLTHSERDAKGVAAGVHNVWIIINPSYGMQFIAEADVMSSLAPTFVADNFEALGESTQIPL